MTDDSYVVFFCPLMGSFVSMVIFLPETVIWGTISYIPK